MRIEPDVLDALKTAEVNGSKVVIPGKLDRNLYVRVNKVLEAIGGEWNKKAKGHLFKDDPADRIDTAIVTGSVVVPKDEFDFFPTPADVAESVALMASIQATDTLLEPSAGNGALVRACGSYTRRITACEIQKNLCVDLAKMPQVETVYSTDFLSLDPLAGPFDRIVMNPPFSKLRDLDHVMHAWRFLKPGGMLVSIMAPGWTFRQDKKCTNFREFVAKQGTWSKLPEQSFKESGTMVNTVVVRLVK